MPYRYLEEVATADVAFEAWGDTLEEAFVASAEAAMNVMVDDLGSIRKDAKVALKLENEELDLLLFDFLNELVYYKDAKRLLLVVDSIKIGREKNAFTLKADASGDMIDPERHPLKVDVKAVTLHMFSLVEKDGKWKATVVLDI